TAEPPLAERKGPTTADPPLAERKEPTRDGPPSTAQEESTAAELPLAEQDQSAGGQLFLTQSVSGTGWPLVEPNGSVIGPGLPLGKQQRSKAGAVRSPAEVEESAGSEMPLAGQSRSTLGLEPPLAVRDRSITQADQPLAQQRKSTVAEPALAGQGKLIIGSGLPFGEQDRSTKGTEQSQAEQNQSPDEQPPPVTVTELSSVEPERSKMRIKAKLAACSLIERSGSPWKREPFSAGVGMSSDRVPQSVLETESRRSPAARRAVSSRGTQMEEGRGPAGSERWRAGALLPGERWRAVGEVGRSPGVLGQADTAPSDLQVRRQRGLGASRAAEAATSATLAPGGSLDRRPVSGDGTAPARSAPTPVPTGEGDGQRILNEARVAGETGPPPSGDIWQGDNTRGPTQE
ncbi:hypothetical protein chiPu_0025691, partial [Chiloscyllium punctatum]|nr:hypothetical protein [Chiloscyllium punctatum]